MLAELRQAIQRLERPAGFEADAGVLPFGIPVLDAVLGGGLARGALHEISAASESHIAAATGFALALREPSKAAVWIAQDMALLESGAPCGTGLDEFGLDARATAHGRGRATARSAMGDGRSAALPRHRRGDRRIAAREYRRGGAAAAFACRRRHWRAGAAAARRAIRSTPRPRRRAGSSAPRRRSHDTALVRRASVAQLVRNRRGPTGSWMLEWSDTDERFVLASTHPQPVAAAGCSTDRLARQSPEREAAPLRHLRQARQCRADRRARRRGRTTRTAA